MTTAARISILAGIRGRLLFNLWVYRRMMAESPSEFTFSAAWYETMELVRAMQHSYAQHGEQAEWHRAVTESRKEYVRYHGKWGRL